MRYISGRLPYLPWIYDNDTTGPDFGKTTLENVADNVRFGQPKSIGSGLVQVPVYLNNNHDGAFGVRFATNSDIESVTPILTGRNTVSADNSADVAVVAGNGAFDAQQPVAMVTMKETATLLFSDIRFNEIDKQTQTLDVVDAENASINVFPNPVTSSVTIGANAATQGNMTIRVFDSFGKLVNTVLDENVAAGLVNATWGTTDAAGNTVAAGSYIVRIEGAGVSTSKVITVVR
jgi:hypothetical protein